MSGSPDVLAFDRWDPGETTLTRVDPESLRPFASQVPELQAAFAARDAAKDAGISPDVPDIKGFFPWIAHEAGLTAKENYEGLPAALALGYYYLYPVAQGAWTIEKQLSGVLEEGYKALAKFNGAASGAIGTAESAGAQIYKDLGIGVSTFENTVLGAFGWL